MKARILEKWNMLLAALLSVLGFSSCDKLGITGGGGGTLCEYGVPTATFKVMGHVTDEEGNAVEGIKVTVQDVSLELWSGSSDASGNYESEDCNMTGELPSDDLLVIMEDIDGEANGGTFRKDTLSVGEITVKKVAEGSGWSTGTYEVTADEKLTRE